MGKQGSCGGSVVQLRLHFLDEKRLRDDKVEPVRVSSQYREICAGEGM